MATAEQFIIQLEERISGPAKTALSAIGQLEAKIAQQAGVVSNYEQKLAAAAAKLQMLGEGDARGAVNVAAFRRQAAAVEAFQQKLDAARASMGQLEGARGLAGKVDASAAAAAVVAAEKRKQAALRETLANQKAVDAASAAQQTAAAAKWNANVDKQIAAQKKFDAAQQRSQAVTKKTNVNLGEIGGKLGQLGGPLGAAGAKVGQLGGAFSALGSLGPVGLVVGIVVAVIALVAALAMAAFEMAKFAIVSADAARSQRLSIESLEVSYKALVGLNEILPRVVSNTGLAADEVKRLAEDLAKAKVPAKNMEVALQAMAMATAGGASAEFIDKLRKGLIATGKIPPELAEQMRRFEEIAGKKLLSLDAQNAKLKANFAGLFRDVNIEPLLKAFSQLVALFDESTASGRALKFLIDSFSGDGVGLVTGAVQRMVRTFLQVELAVLRAYAAWLRFKESLAQGAGGTGMTPPPLPPPPATTGHKAALQASGTSMMQGMAAGITAGGPGVIGAISGVIDQAVAAAKAKLEQRSPSRVFTRIGLQNTAGLAAGHEEGAPAVRRSMEDMVAVPGGRGPGAIAKPSGGAAAPPSKQVTFSNCTFGEGTTESKLREWVMAMLHEESLEPEPA